MEIVSLEETREMGLGMKSRHGINKFPRVVGSV